MSIRLMSMVWDVSFPTQSQKLIALKLADYASDYGTSVFPAVNTIADQTGCDERTVQRTLKAFRGCGLLNLIREGGTGPRATNEWSINIECLTVLSSGAAEIVGSSSELEINLKGVTAMGDIMGDTVSPIDPVRVTPVSPKGGMVSAKGDTRVTQSTNNHQDPSSASALRLILKSDHEWKHWLDHSRVEYGDEFARAFDQEGAMVVTGFRPFKGCGKPKLPPAPSNPKFEELMKARVTVLTERSRRMQGDE